ncbi:hypothetical protein Ancab_012485 [Ancistrocladus abbreviatus]
MAEKVGKKNDEAAISMPNDGSSVPPTYLEDTASEGSKQPHNGAATKKGPSAEDIANFFLNSANLVLDVLILIVITPLYLLVTLAVYLIFDINLTERDKSQHKEQEKNRIIFENVLQKCRDAAVGAANLVSRIRIQILFTLLVWLVINLSVPGLRRKTVLGSPLWKWSLLVVIIACGYIAIKRVVIFTLALLLNKAAEDGRYYAGRLRSSIKLIIFSASVFFFWQCHFLSHRGLEDADNGVDYVMWTMVALLTFSVLWLVKTILLLQWEAKAMYHRFTPRLLRAGFQLYLLIAIMAVEEKTDEEREELMQEVKKNLMPSSQDIKTYRSNLNKKKEAFLEREEKQDATTSRLERIASSLLYLPKDPLGGEDLMSYCQARSPEINSIGPDEPIMADDLKKFQLDENERDRVYKDLQGNPPVEKVTCKMFEEWMKRRCYQNFSAFIVISGVDNNVCMQPKESSREVDPDISKPPAKYATVKNLSTFNPRTSNGKYKVQNLSTFKPRTGNGKFKVQNLSTFKPRTSNGKYEVRKGCTLVEKALKESSKEDDIASLRAKCQKIKHDHEYIISKTDLSKFGLNEIESELLYEEVQGNPPSEKVTYAMFEKWMVGAYKYSLALGYTLLHAKEVVDCLNLIMSGSVIAMVILVWLLLTGLASTKVLIAIMSGFVGATFIFGDTCKALFEGIIFAFARHPFDVGDLCIIDGIEMEVKRMSILTTVFLKLSPPEEIFYPNSVLATKHIVNLKDELDSSDAVELNLDGSTKKKKIEALKEKIENFSESGNHAHKYEGPIQVMLKEVGSSIKMDVHFKHSMGILDNHAQCSQKKKMQRSEFLLHVKQFLDDLGINRASV